MQNLVYFKQLSFAYVQSLNIKTGLFQTIHFSIITVFVYIQFNAKSALFETIQFIIHTGFSFIWFIGKILLGASTPGQSGPGSDGNEMVLRIPQNSGIAEASPSDSLVSYPRHLSGEFYHCTEIQSVYSAAPVNWVLVRKWTL